MRDLDFNDGFTSASEPNQGSLTANKIKAFANDAAFEADKGGVATEGDIYSNTTTNTLEYHDGTSFRSIANLDTSQTFAGDLTISGTTTIIDSTNLDVTDKNITVNDGGNDASSEGAGLTVERTSTDFSIIGGNAYASKFAAGFLGSEKEILTDGHSQTVTFKDIDGGTATNSSRITLPKETFTNIDALTDKEGTVAYDTTDDTLVFNDGTNWHRLGSIEEVQALASATSTTTTAGTPIDVTGASISLTAGTWDIFYHCNVRLTRQAATTSGQVLITDGSNTIIDQGACLVRDNLLTSGQPRDAVAQASVRVTITSTTTYKLRIECDQSSGNGTFACFAAGSGFTEQDSRIFARRVR